MEVGDQFHTSGGFISGDMTPVTTGQEAGWAAQSRSGRSGENKNAYTCQKWNPGRPARSVVTILTSLLWLGPRKVTQTIRYTSLFLGRLRRLRNMAPQRTYTHIAVNSLDLNCINVTCSACLRDTERDQI